MTKWEYLTVELHHYKGQVVVDKPESLRNKELNELGDDGWEAVAAFRVEGQELLLFKRPAREETQREASPLPADALQAIQRFNEIMAQFQVHK